MHRRKQEFQTIRSEGGLLPPDLFRRVLDPKEGLDGTRPEDYGLPQGERLNEVITQSWNRLRKHWAEFRAAAEFLPETEPGTGLTNDRWSLPLLRELGFGLLPTTAGPEIGGRTYAINRFFGPVPIHLVGCGLSLDRRAAGVRGAAAANPHGLVQEFINRSTGHLWAIVSNGLRLRLLRNNQALSRQSFLEFDVEAMFAGELYSDFVLLWLVAHATRFAPREGNKPDTCWLEQWTRLADEQGTRALGELRGGVEKALQILGEGFTSHPKNTALRDGLRTGQVSLADFHGQLLRVVYRLIFLFVAEDRTLDGLPLLHPRDGSEPAMTARERFALHYGTARLREMAAKIKGSRHGDLWRQFQIIVAALSGDANFAVVRQALALPALGSFLWDPSSTLALNAAELANHDFLEALRDLAFTRQGKVLRPVDYENLGAEELGGVYETLLALTPQISADGSRFTFAEFAGNERKTSGAYYTPDSLVQCLLDSALDPIVEEAINGKSGSEAEKAILALKVCDPAVGSGHFLVGAAHRLAIHLARVRAVAHGEGEASALVYQHALRDVIGHCLYGVDVNPMAAELCRVSLWLEAIEPGKPLSFLEHRIQCGNSLLGATPALLAKGVPDGAFNPIEGDNKEICREFKRINKDEHNLQMRLFVATTEPWEQLGNLAVSLANLDSIDDNSLEGIREKQKQYEQTMLSADYLSGRFWADAWCAAFVWKKTREFNYPITEEVFRRIEHNPNAVDPWMRNEIQRLAGQYQFFHWHLAFPDVFRVPPFGVVPENEQADWNGGFDCVLGNPPWERIQVEANQFFASRKPDWIELRRSEREIAIKILEQNDPRLFSEWVEQRRFDLATTAFLKVSGHFPLSTQKNVNSYAVFMELAMELVAVRGRCGLILQSGIATDDIMKPLFQALTSERRLVSFFDFVNLEGLFPGVHRTHPHFCLLTAAGPQRALTAEFSFWNTNPSQLRDSDRRFKLSVEDIALLNPNTRTCPIFRSKRDAELSKAIYRRTPILWRDGPPEQNPWALSIRRIFSMAYDSGDFIPSVALPDTDSNLVRVYEAKLFHQFDHRYGTYDPCTVGLPECRELRDTERLPQTLALPRFWAEAKELSRRLASSLWAREYLLAYRDVTNAANERTCISCILPRQASDDTVRVLLPKIGDAAEFGALIANLNSFILDYAARNCVASTHLSEYLAKQLPIVPPATHASPCPWNGLALPVKAWETPRVLELIYTAWDLEPFARDCGWPGPPFYWDEERRFLLRCELDAAFFHLYLPSEPNGEWRPAEGEIAEELEQLKVGFPTPRDTVTYIMDTFPIVRRRDEEKYDGDYRTKRVILEFYDAIQESMHTGKPYQTRLDPPPADPRCRHPKPKVGILAFGSLIDDAGDELNPRILFRIKAQTPFPVEYGRYSGKTRGGAPTLVPHRSGSPVAAEILVLDNEVTVVEASNMLWRRETRRIGTGEEYSEGTGPNSVLVQSLNDNPCVRTVLFTDFPNTGKITEPTAEQLADCAIHSVKAANDGMDGISYLIDAIKCGIETRLTRAYRDEILRQTNSPTLEEALRTLKSP
jgi:hypothetical protein